MLTFNNAVSNLLHIDKPIIQAGMIWVSGWKLASAVSNAGGLGTIGAGSMYPDVLEKHLKKMNVATAKPYAVNLPLLYPDIDKHIETIIRYKVPVVITSAGNPKLYTEKLKQAGCKVLHVVSSTKFALKAEAAGVDAVIAEGFEAGGHNGREETTSFVLIPMVKDSVRIPVIAAGGIATGRQMMAARILGADGVQIGSRFVTSVEASCHQNFKDLILKSEEGDTQISLKQVTPVRLLKNEFYKKVQQLETSGASVQELNLLLGKGRAKKGMYEGDLVEGELEIGQVAAMLDRIEPAATILEEIWREYNSLQKGFTA